jgi:dihydrofolate reductase
MNTLMRHGFVDELRLMIFTVIVGKRLFEDGEDGRTLKLVDSKTLGTGVVSLAPKRRAPRRASGRFADRIRAP